MSDLIAEIYHARGLYLLGVSIHPEGLTVVCRLALLNILSILSVRS
jgi:hypothetical protein